MKIYFLCIPDQEGRKTLPHLINKETEAHETGAGVGPGLEPHSTPYEPLGANHQLSSGQELRVAFPIHGKAWKGTRGSDSV